MNLKNILITGASGHVGHKLMLQLSKQQKNLGLGNLIGIDIRPPYNPWPANCQFHKMDIRSLELHKLIAEGGFHTIIHLASIVTPPKGMSEQTMYAIDVEGTKNIVQAAQKYAVKKLAVSSSGAAYGYYSDNPEWLTETDPIRGNESFAYSRHKRMVEELLDQAREKTPLLDIFVFRICTILGHGIDNQITDIFKKPILLGIQGSDTPFVFIWDEDVVNCFASVINSEKPGNYNLAGDGKLTIDELGKLLGKPVLKLPANVVKGAIKVLKKFNLTQYAEEQVQFIQYRPVLLNEKLKKEYLYQPQKTSLETFRFFQHQLKS